MRTRIKWILASLAALAALLWAALRGRSPWRGRAEKAQEAAQAAQREAVSERRRREEQEAKGELEKKRSQSAADRLAGVLARARARLRADAGGD